MIIKKAVYKEKSVVQSIMVSADIHGCDECKCEIDKETDKDSLLSMTVFRQKPEQDSERLDFCSWDCVLKHLPKIKTDYFVDLPFLYYDAGRDGKRGISRLLELIGR